MPRNDEAKRLPSAFKDRRGELPLTRFQDLESSLQVALVDNVPVGITSTIAQFVKAGLCTTAKEAERKALFPGELEDVMSGGALWQALEIVHFTLCIKNVTRVFTHQLVRARIGVTFSQQCTGEVDHRHCDFLVPRCISQNPTTCNAYTRQCLKAKELYANLIDLGTPLQEARFVMPQCQSTFIYMHGSIGMLAGLYKKRKCTMTNSWEMGVFAKKLAETLVGHHPWLKALFAPNPCAAGKCFFHAARSSGLTIAHLFSPDKEHDTFDWTPKSFVHGSHAAASSGPMAMPSSYYEGERNVSKDEWEKARKERVG